jgi:hypothetical protein
LDHSVAHLALPLHKLPVGSYTNLVLYSYAHCGTTPGTFTYNGPGALELYYCGDAHYYAYDYNTATWSNPVFVNECINYSQTTTRSASGGAGIRHSACGFHRGCTLGPGRSRREQPGTQVQIGPHEGAPSLAPPFRLSPAGWPSVVQWVRGMGLLYRLLHERGERLADG